MEALKQRYGDKVDFLAVYVREAHPTDGWRMASNDAVGIKIKQPHQRDERESAAKTCCSSLKITMPLLVDEMDDRVGHAYSGMPDRLYLIDRKGRIAYKGGRGPFGFKPGELEQSLILLLLDQESSAAQSSAAGQIRFIDSRETMNRNHSLTVTALTNTEAWKKMMPHLDKQCSQPLPVWIRALAVSLPRTAAAMLDVDYAQRVESTLPPQLRAKLRWIAADANRCDYAKAYARFDYVQAGGKAEDIDELTNRFDKLPEAERLALRLVRQLVEAAYRVTDEQIAQLVELYGEKQVVAIVLVAAYSNFQDRFLLALGAEVEEDGPLPPVQVHLSRRSIDSRESMSRHRSLPVAAQLPPIPQRLDDPEWTALSFDTLRERLNKQIARRRARVRIPSWETVRANLPDSVPKPEKPSRIQWTLLTLGYQPRLAAPWSSGRQAFRAESDLGAVYYESMFWVITRSLQCFY